MNLLREIFLTLCFVPALLLALVFVPPFFAYGPVVFAIWSMLSSAGVTVLGVIVWAHSSDAKTKAPRSVVRGTWLASAPLLVYILVTLVQSILGAFRLLT